jgi:hypothetical protein
MKAVRKRTQLPARDAATTVAANPTRHQELSQRIAAPSNGTLAHTPFMRAKAPASLRGSGGEDGPDR